MANELVLSRLDAILSVLKQAHGGGRGMPSACVGNERESFINLVLSNAIAPPFRIGTGAITDRSGHVTGQLDVVIEYQVSVSFPLLLGDAPRLYLAEPVCAVLEIKSNIADSWPDVLATADKVRSIARANCALSSVGRGLPRHIPFFAVGYSGWRTVETISERLEEAKGSVEGVLVIDPGIYVWRDQDDFNPLVYHAHHLEGPRALFGLFLSLEGLMSGMISMKPPYGEYI